MRAVQDLSFTIAQTVAAGTYVNDPQEKRYDTCENLLIVAQLVGVTGGTLDVTIQDSPDGVTWFDLAHFAQLAGGAAAVAYAYAPTLTGAIAIATIGSTVDPATPVPVLAAGSVRGGHPLSFLRAVCVVGAGASVGKIQTITVFAR